MNPLFNDMPVTVFEVMSGLARETGAINLGQGFPDDEGAEDIRAHAANAIISGPNQYPPMMGLPELRHAVAQHYQRWYSMPLLTDDNVMITSGATEALAASFLALIEPGDEVIIFEPFYDAYVPMVLRAGGIPKFVTLIPPDFRLTFDALNAAFTERTKLVVFNNPSNPTGIVYDVEQVTLLANFCIKFDVIAVCDEVWEHIVFDGCPHVPLISLPLMAERCVKIGSAGKIFNLTGWKVGFVCAAASLLKPISKAHQFLTFTTPPALQKAVAYGLAKPDGFFKTLRSDLQRSRDRLTFGLLSSGFKVVPSMGTYFLNIDISEFIASGFAMDDRDFAFKMAHNFGVVGIPVSAFYASSVMRHLIRLCFAKHDATLDEALLRLQHFKA